MGNRVGVAILCLLSFSLIWHPKSPPPLSSTELALLTESSCHRAPGGWPVSSSHCL